MRKSLIVLLLCGASTLFAQPAGRGRGPMGPRGKGGMATGASRTVTGAPYSAVEVREVNQTLPNGNVIARKIETNMYRDGMGRTRAETTIQPRAGATKGPRTLVTIHDPVAGVTRELNSQTKVAQEIPIPRGSGGFAGGARAGRGGGKSAAVPRTAPVNPNVVSETLPMQTINGVQATGTRVTRTIPVGEIGNAQPIKVVHEVWVSPDLKLPVMTKDTDRNGKTTTTQLTNITRSEPDPALFQSPSDYTVRRFGRGAAR